VTIEAVLSNERSWCIAVGDCRDRLRAMPKDSVHCVVTSPPYWALRDYDIEPSVWGGDGACQHEFAETTQRFEMRKTVNLARSDYSTRGGAKKITPDQVVTTGICQRCGAWLGCFGNEPTPELYLEHAVEIFEEVRRVLRPDGVLWLNIGDSYANDGKFGGQASGLHSYLDERNRTRAGREKRRSGLKPKELVGIPWMLALALRQAGWWLRAEQIWWKKAPTPESCKDRPSRSHEQVFLLTKRAHYAYDYFAITEMASENTHSRGKGLNPKAAAVDAGNHHGVPKANNHFSGKVKDIVVRRNSRSVWHLSPEGYKGKHFAVMPTELARRCLKAGTMEHGCCSVCGKPWKRIVRKVRVATRSPKKSKIGVRDNGLLPPQSRSRVEVGNRDPERHVTSLEHVGWKPGCQCEAEVIPCVALDPFSGAGTTVMVARKLGLRAIGLERSEKYAADARRRIIEDAPLFNS